MKLFVTLMLGLGMGWSCASLASDTCENAVDSADTMNVNQKDCDYTNKGLNGALQKAFKKGSEGAVLATQPEAKASAENLVQQAADLSMSIEFEQWADVAMMRVQLLQKMLEQCPKGIGLLGETYRPLAKRRIELSIKYACLN